MVVRPVEGGSANAGARAKRWMWPTLTPRCSLYSIFYIISGTLYSMCVEVISLGFRLRSALSYLSPIFYLLYMCTIPRTDGPDLTQTADTHNSQCCHRAIF